MRKNKSKLDTYCENNMIKRPFEGSLAVVKNSDTYSKRSNV